jgi:excisionase family DNA binding protein
MKVNEGSRPSPGGLPRLAYSPAEVGDVLGLSRAMVFKLLAAGELPSCKIGRSRRILHTAVVDYLDRLEGGDGDAAA